MVRFPRIFRTVQRTTRPFTWGDGLALIGVIVIVYIGARLAFDAPDVIVGPDISLAPRALPWYSALSLGRMVAAYLLSMGFTLLYGRAAAYNRRAERVLMPLLDVLQSVPILSFLPVVLLSLSVVLPVKVAAELSSIVLIFTSQVWNLTFAWYQSLTTIPKELREASDTFRLNSWLRFKFLEFPFASISLVWNSMMSWAGGWFFLMAAEIFTVGDRDFRLRGLGAYLHEAANQGDLQAIAWGLGALILLIIALDQLLWRPLIAWSDRFKLEMVEGGQTPTSWVYDSLRNARITDWLERKVITPLSNSFDSKMVGRSQARQEQDERQRPFNWLFAILGFAVILILIYGIFNTGIMLAEVPGEQWLSMLQGTLATLVRVAAALAIALAWTIPIGVAIGTNPRLSALLQPVVQVAASVPATALFPLLLLFVLRLPGGLNLAAVLLMLMGTQWYLLFNIIAGANAIPQDLKYTATLMKLPRFEYWRTLILPALFPYLITGAITASGGAWNASIVAEYVTFAGETLQTTGIGAVITGATAEGDYRLLLASTLSMVITVVLINRLVWRRLYAVTEDKYRME